TLNLARMEIEGQHTVCPSLGNQVRHQLGGYRRARPGLSILARIAVVGKYGSNAARRTSLQGVDRDQQFHQVVVRRVGGRLDDEDILTPDVLVDLDEDFHVGKAPHGGLRQGKV